MYVCTRFGCSKSCVLGSAVVARTVSKNLTAQQRDYMKQLAAVDELWMTPPGRYSRPVLNNYDLVRAITQ